MRSRAFELRLEILGDLLLAHLCSNVVLHAGMNWGAAPRICHADDRLFLHVFNFNQRGTVFGDVAAVGYDECHRFANIGHPTVGERCGLHLRRNEEKAQHVDLEVRQVWLSVDGMHAGDFARRVGVDRDDTAPRNGAACEGDMQHARQRNVVDELAAAGQQAWILLATHALADVAPGADAGSVHVFFSLSAPASFFAARRMP
jgi:hypothetical protein